MKTVTITEDFDGYPNGIDKRRFTAGEEPSLSNEYAAFLVAKGLAREPEATKAGRSKGGRKPRAEPAAEEQNEGDADPGDGDGAPATDEANHEAKDEAP